MTEYTTDEIRKAIQVLESVGGDTDALKAKLETPLNDKLAEAVFDAYDMRWSLVGESYRAKIRKAVDDVLSVEGPWDHLDNVPYQVLTVIDSEGDDWYRSGSGWSMHQTGGTEYPGNGYSTGDIAKYGPYRKA